MFCGKCGAQNADDARFCGNCGQRLNSEQTVKKGISVVQDSKAKYRMLGMIAVAVVVVLAVLLINALLGGRSYEDTVKKYIDAQIHNDISTIYELFPEEVVEYELEEEGYEGDIDAYIDEIEEEMEESFDDVEETLGKDWDVSYKILGSRDVVGNELTDLQESYEDFDMKISEAKDVQVEITFKVEELDSKNVTNVPVIKIGRSWYLDLEKMRGLF